MDCCTICSDAATVPLRCGGEGAKLKGKGQSTLLLSTVFMSKDQKNKIMGALRRVASRTLRDRAKELGLFKTVSGAGSPWRSLE